MKRKISGSSLFLFILILLFAMIGTSEADYEGTIGTRFTITDSGFGTKKPRVYVEYEKKPGVVRRVYARVETWSDTSITSLWTGTISPGTYDLFVKPNIIGAVPISEGQFSIVNPVIDEVTPAAPTADAKMTINGQFFTNKKPRVYLKDLISQKRKGCRVLNSTMDPETGASSLSFVVPKWVSGNYEVDLQNPIGTASFTLVSISGKVTDSSTGLGLSRVVVNLDGTDSAYVTTGNDGSYSFTGIQHGSYTITPTKSGYTFSPQSITVTVSNSDIAEQGFVGTLATLPIGQLSLNINPTTLPTGTVNTPYNQAIMIATSGGNPPYTYSCSVSGGSGMSASVSPSSDISWCNFCPICTIEGTPANSNIYNVTVNVTDASQSVASANASFNVKPEPSYSSGLDWHLRNSGTTSDLMAVTYGNGVFIAVGYGGTILTSTDGATWTEANSGTASYIGGIAYGNGIFVAVGGDDTIPSNTILTSPDGTTWTRRSSPSVVPDYLPLNAVTYGNGIFVAGGIDTIQTSQDGVNWIQRSSGLIIDPTSYFQITGIAYGNDIYIAVGSIEADCTPFKWCMGFGNVVLSSWDGATWSIPSSEPTPSVSGVTYGNGIFVAVGDGDILTSTDGATWTQTNDTCLITVTYGNGIFVAVGYGGAILTSTDGATWTGTTSGTFSSLYGVTYGNGTFVAVGANGIILQSDPVK